MLTPPFISEFPDDLGHEAAWLGREVMRGLMDLRRHQPEDDRHGATMTHERVRPFLQRQSGGLMA